MLMADVTTSDQITQDVIIKSEQAHSEYTNNGQNYGNKTIVVTHSVTLQSLYTVQPSIVLKAHHKININNNIYMTTTWFHTDSRQW